MPALPNGRHEKFARGIVEGLSIDAAYTAAGYRPDRGHASRLATNGSVRTRVEELMTEAARETVLSARWCIDELAKNHARAVAKGDLSNSNRALELIGRHFRAWAPEDAADATQDHIPLAERLKHYEKEAQKGAEQQKAIDQSDDKIVRLSRDQPGRERSASS